jgi:hypothetical protein
MRRSELFCCLKWKNCNIVIVVDQLYSISLCYSKHILKLARHLALNLTLVIIDMPLVRCEWKGQRSLSSRTRCEHKCWAKASSQNILSSNQYIHGNPLPFEHIFHALWHLPLSQHARVGGHQYPNRTKSVQWEQLIEVSANTRLHWLPAVQSNHNFRRPWSCIVGCTAGPEVRFHVRKGSISEVKPVNSLMKWYSHTFRLSRDCVNLL